MNMSKGSFCTLEKAKKKKKKRRKKQKKKKRGRTQEHTTPTKWNRIGRRRKEKKEMEESAHAQTHRKYSLFSFLKLEERWMKRKKMEQEKRRRK